MNKVPFWLLPLAASLVLCSLLGYLLGPHLGLSPLAGTNWGILVGALTGSSWAASRRPQP